MISASTTSLISRLSPFVRLAHDFPTPAGFELKPRIINDHAFLYFKQGRGTFLNARTSYSIAPGTLFLVRPNVEHSFQGRGFYMLNMHVDLIERPDSAAIDYQQRRDDPHPPRAQDMLSAEALPVCIAIRRTAVYERLFFCVHRLFQVGGQASRIQIKAAMLDLIAFLFAEVQQQQMSPALRSQLPGLESAVRYMQTNFHRPISHTEVAREARMSGSYFARCFKEYYQLSPIRFLMQLRMEKAKTELTLTELPVKAVAAGVGFQTVHHFTRAFTRHVGISPAAYRDMHGQV